MIMTAKDVVCIIPEDEFLEGVESSVLTADDYLIHKERADSAWMSSYEYQEERGVIRLSSYFDRDGENIDILHNSLLGNYTDLVVVDTIHGVFRGCYVSQMQYVCHNPLHPHVVAEINCRELIPWNKELPHEAFNIDPDFHGVWDGGRSGRPLPSMHPSQVSLEGVSIFGGPQNEQKNTSLGGDKTRSLSVLLKRNGDISVRQIIALKGDYWMRDVDPSDPRILEILKGRIGFGNKPGRIPGHLGWMLYLADDDDEEEGADEDEEAIVRFHWGDEITISMKSPEMKGVTYVEESLEFIKPEEKEPEDGKEFLYRLYYDGRVVPE